MRHAEDNEKFSVFEFSSNEVIESNNIFIENTDGTERARTSTHEAVTENAIAQNFLLLDEKIEMKRDRIMNEESSDNNDLTASKANAIARMTSAIISMLASIAMMTMILRSYDGLTTPLHRLLFGLCVSDILSSFASSLSTTMAFSETSYYIWNASGNIASCDTQGFLLAFGSSAGIMYNCCLCLYYFAVSRDKSVGSCHCIF